MIQVIREVGIFIVIAQAVLYFVPGESYVKYVKIIIGIIMIAKMAQPLLVLVDGQQWQRILEEMPDFQSFSGAELPKDREGTERLEATIERELLGKLNAEPLEGYTACGAAFACAPGREAQELVITVSDGSGRDGQIRIDKITLGESKAQTGEAKALAEHYGRLLGMEPERIRIKME